MQRKNTQLHTAGQSNDMIILFGGACGGPQGGSLETSQLLPRRDRCCTNSPSDEAKHPLHNHLFQISILRLTLIQHFNHFS